MDSFDFYKDETNLDRCRLVSFLVSIIEDGNRTSCKAAIISSWWGRKLFYQMMVHMLNKQSSRALTGNADRKTLFVYYI